MAETWIRRNEHAAELLHCAIDRSRAALAVAAATAKQYGMGIEIEMDNNILNMTPSGATYREKVQSYFSYGSTEGYKGIPVL